MITFRYGCPPNLPWWKLQNMTDAEIQKYNEGFMVTHYQLCYCPKCDTQNETILCPRCDTTPKIVGTTDNVYATQIWNEAIEAAALVADNSSDDKYNYYHISRAIRKLKK